MIAVTGIPIYYAAYSLVLIFVVQVLVPFVNNLLVLDLEGERLFAKYYDGKNKAQQQAHEAVLYKKTKAVPAKTEGR